MRLRVALMAMALAAGSIVLVAGPANAGCDWVREVRVVNGMIQVHFEYHCMGDEEGDSEQVTSEMQPPRDSDWDAVCVRSALAVGANPAEFCDEPPQLGPAPIPSVTPDLVGRAFRDLPLPASELVVQPPGGETLVNFDTNFYTEQGSFTRTVRLLGQRVDLKIWPSRYQWMFGDGASLASESAGAPYPDLQITHDYQSKGGVSPRVDTTYSAQFSVNGGPWRDVDGTVTIPGSPVRLEVRTARPVLVGYH
ncbi:hypothetical protein GCM10009844_15680 [Nocardioides koreensis]|uniref:PKD domain-containing protein n=1 Tax=Nocardioides koreensis TaxID=433651 RepID=A0ABN2ZJY4_9ACTN